MDIPQLAELFKTIFETSHGQQTCPQGMGGSIRKIYKKYGGTICNEVEIKTIEETKEGKTNFLTKLHNLAYGQS